MFAPPTHDSRRARWARRRHPGLGYCGRCGFPWRAGGNDGPGVPHHTPYGWNEDGGVSWSRGCFPLCEPCWANLTIPERVPYYESLVAHWALDAMAESRYDPNASNRDLDAILMSVRAGN